MAPAIWPTFNIVPFIKLEITVQEQALARRGAADVVCTEHDGSGRAELEAVAPLLAPVG